MLTVQFEKEESFFKDYDIFIPDVEKLGEKGNERMRLTCYFYVDQIIPHIKAQNMTKLFVDGIRSVVRWKGF